MPFFKNPTLVWAGSMLVLLATALYNAPGFLESLQKLPGSYDRTKSQFMGWVKEDEEWKGEWTAFPEGVVDMPAMALSETDLVLQLEAAQGHLSGTIATKRICHSIPFFSFVLVEGYVSGNSADLSAFDFVGGVRTEFARLKLHRDKDVLTVTAVQDPRGWFPGTLRIGRSPLASNTLEPDATLCRDELRRFMEQAATGSQGGG